MQSCSSAHDAQIMFIAVRYLTRIQFHLPGMHQSGLKVCSILREDVLVMTEIQSMIHWNCLNLLFSQLCPSTVEPCTETLLIDLWNSFKSALLQYILVDIRRLINHAIFDVRWGSVSRMVASGWWEFNVKAVSSTAIHIQLRALPACRPLAGSVLN